VKTFVVTMAAILCVARNGLGGDDSKKTGTGTPAPALIQAVAMPRVGSSSTQKTDAHASATSIVQPGAAPRAASPSPVRPPRRDPLKQAVLDAAQPRFDDLIDRALRAKSAYGFETDDDLNLAELGDPLPVYTVSEKDAAAFAPGQKIDAVLKVSGTWLVPVNVSGSGLRTFIEVTRQSDNTFEGGRASVITARVWKTINARWPANKNFHPKLVTYPGIPGYFFTVPEIEPQNLSDIVVILSEVDHPATLSPAAVTLHSWR